MIKSLKPDFLFLSETFSKRDKIKSLCSKFGFAEYWSVDSVGRGGGLAIFWRRNVSCKVSDFSSNHIDVVMLKDNVPEWRMTCFYGFPERTRRRESWDFIKEIANKSLLPWCIVGDFNDMLSDADKKNILSIYWMAFAKLLRSAS